MPFPVFVPDLPPLLPPFGGFGACFVGVEEVLRRGTITTAPLDPTRRGYGAGQCQCGP